MPQTRCLIAILLLLLAACSEPTDNVASQTHDTMDLRPSSASLRSIITNPGNLSDTTRLAQLEAVLHKAGTDSASLREVSSVLLAAFDNPNSPFRNNKLATTIWNEQLRSPFLSPEEKAVITKKITLAQQNEPGHAANNFGYTNPLKRKGTLYQIAAPFTLVYFYNPECHACQEMTGVLTASNVISTAISTNRLALLAMYTDRDVALWRRHLFEMPDTWLHGRDSAESIWNNRVYDLRAIPCLYLLDSSKRVLIKDGSVADVERLLSRQ